MCAKSTKCKLEFQSKNKNNYLIHLWYIKTFALPYGCLFYPKPNSKTSPNIKSPRILLSTPEHMFPFNCGIRQWQNLHVSCYSKTNVIKENQCSVCKTRHHMNVKVGVHTSNITITNDREIWCLCPHFFHRAPISKCMSMYIMIWFDLIFGVERHFHQYFSYIMATSFSGGRSRSTLRKPPTMGK